MNNPPGLRVGHEGLGSGGSCGTPTQPGDGESGQPSGALDYAAIGAELEGLDQDARWDRLVELAEQEAGTFEVYATLVNDQLGPVMEEFVTATGSERIQTSHYRSGSVEVLEGILQESEAGQPRADAVITTAIDLTILSDRALLEPFETPVTEDVVEDVVFPDWAGVYINAYTLARNTDLVGDGEAPGTWEEALGFADQPVGIEVQSYDLFTTLVTYFMDDRGMSEEEAVELFTAAEADLFPVRGRSALAEFTAAGEYGLAIGTYTQNVDNYREDDAPIAWEPPVEPVVQRPNGVTAMADSDMPATALLFVDYMLGESGQEILASFARIPTNVKVDGALPEEYEVVTLDVEEMVENREKWTNLYSQVTGEPVEEEGG